MENAARRLKAIIYRDSVRDIMQELGMENAFRGLYRSIIGDSGSSGRTVSHSAEEVTAEFYRTKHIPDRLPEREVVSDLVSRVSAGDIFYDLGANRGLYSCIVGQKLVDGTVHAFEPNPTAVADLRRNIELNGLSQTILVHQKAVSGSAGTVQFVVKSESTGNTLQKSLVEEDDQQVTVDAITLDDYAEAVDLPLPTVMKIDIEGAEFDALSEMSRCLTRCRVCYCEVHEWGSREKQESENPAEVLRNCDFENVERIYNRSGSHYIIRAY
nr:FkbM family methyltransferase [Salinibacter ruber]